MNKSDKIRALYMGLELILNALEELEEDPHMFAGEAAVYGESGLVAYAADAKRWEAVTS